MTIEEHFEPTTAQSCRYCGALVFPEDCEIHLDECEQYEGKDIDD